VIFSYPFVRILKGTTNINEKRFKQEDKYVLKCLDDRVKVPSFTRESMVFTFMIPSVQQCSYGGGGPSLSVENIFIVE